MSIKLSIIVLDRASRTITKIGGKLGGIATKIGNIATKIGRIASIAIPALAAVSLNLIIKLDRGLREIGTLMGGLTDKQMAEMGAQLDMLSMKSGQAMDKLTKARYDIVSAGFTGMAESLVVLDTAADIAVGGVSDIATTADLLTTTLNAYNKTAADAVNTSDKLFTIVRLGKTTMGELAQNLGQVMGIAGAVGIPLEEVGAAVATLTVSLGSTPEAITAVRAAIVELLKPSEELKELIKLTNFESLDAMVATLGFAESLDLIKEVADKNNISMTKLFANIRSMAAILPLTGKQVETFEENLKQMFETTGATAGAVEEMEKAYSQQIAKMRQTWNVLLRNIGRELIPGFIKLVNKANEIFTQFGNIDWKKLGEIIGEQWGSILTDIGKITFLGAKLIGMQLMRGLDEAFRGGAFVKTIEFITDVLDQFAAAIWLVGGNVQQWKRTMDAIQYDQWTESTEGYEQSVSDLKIKIKELAKAIGSDLAPAFGSLLTPIDLSETVIQNLSDGTDKIKLWIDENLDDLYDDLFPDEPPVPDIDLLLTGMLDKWVEKYQDTFDQIAQITDALGSVYANFLDLRKAQIQSELDAQINAVLKSGASEEQKESRISNLKEKARQDEIKAARALKPIQIAQAISNTALAVIKALASTAPPLNFVLAGLVGAAGAAEIATIAAQPFRFGGSPNDVDRIPALLSPREIVSTQEASDQFGDQILRLNQIAASGGILSDNKGNNYYISAMDTQSFVDAIRRDPNGLAEGMQLVREERFL